MSPDDKSLFLDAVEDVQPLKRCTDIHWQQSRNTRVRQEVDTEQLDNFLTLGFLELLPLEEPLAFQREGVQQGVIDPNPETENLIEFYIHKNRNGETGKVPLHYSGPILRISEPETTGYQYTQGGLS